MTPSFSLPFISVVIPTFNAGHCIRTTIDRVVHYFSSKRLSYEIIVVDDGSRDKTSEIVALSAQECSGLIVHKSSINRGKGYAVRTGLLLAKGDVRLFMDADLATDISYFEPAWSKMQEGFDVVVASRSPRDAVGAQQATPESLLRRMSGLAGNLLIRSLVVSGIHDTQCGFKMFSAQAAKEIFSRTTINRWAFDVEALMLAKRLGFKTGIIPVVWHHNEKSSVTLLGFLNTLKELLIIRWMMWATHYHEANTPL